MNEPTDPEFDLSKPKPNKSKSHTEKKQQKKGKLDQTHQANQSVVN